MSLARLAGLDAAVTRGIAQAGTTLEYGMSAELLGAVIESITGQCLSAAVPQRLWTPLKMDDTAVRANPARQPRRCRTGCWTPRAACRPSVGSRCC